VPQHKEVKEYLKKYVPPRDKIIKKHIVISSPRQKLLKELTGQKAMIFPDMFEFKQPLWKKDNYNIDFLKSFNLKENDLIVLQATRIVERKAIELAIDLITELNKRKKELIGKKLWNGKIMDIKSNIIFCFGQFTEPASLGYKNKLIAKMKKQGIKYRFMNRQVEHKRGRKQDKKIYSLWDAYVYADLISYPSIVEGWGNQFIEAIFAKSLFLFLNTRFSRPTSKPRVISISHSARLLNASIGK
jgi:glycosyltransferase involved in cell wall biosynthesis